MPLVGPCAIATVTLGHELAGAGEGEGVGEGVGVGVVTPAVEAVWEVPPQPASVMLKIIMAKAQTAGI